MYRIVSIIRTVTITSYYNINVRTVDNPDVIKLSFEVVTRKSVSLISIVNRLFTATSVDHCALGKMTSIDCLIDWTWMRRQNSSVSLFGEVFRYNHAGKFSKITIGAFVWCKIVTFVANTACYTMCDRISTKSV